MRPNFPQSSSAPGGSNPSGPVQQNEITTEQLSEFSFSELVNLVENPYTSATVRQNAWKMIDIFLWQDKEAPEMWQDWPEMTVDGKLVTKEAFIREVLDNDSERHALSPESPDGDWKNWAEYTVDGKPVDKKTFDHEIDYHNMKTLDFHKRGEEDEEEDEDKEAYHDKAASAQLRTEYALSLISKICERYMPNN